MKNKSAKYITTGGIIAALYIVLSLISHALGLANGQIQVRLSEALCVLPAFTPAAIPGLFVGCLITNLLTGALLPDIIIGSLTTLLAAYLTHRLCRSCPEYKGFRPALLPLVAVLPPVICNSLILPPMLYYVYGFRPLLLNFATVSAGEILSAGVLGFLLYKALCRKSDQLFS